MSRLFPPASFGNVESNVYRSAFPTEVNYGFLQTLNLKTVVILGGSGTALSASTSNDPPPSFWSFLEDLSIRAIVVGTPAAAVASPHDDVQQPQQHSFSQPQPRLSEEMVVCSLQALVDPANHPVLITCASGKYLTGAVVGCLRKMQHWALVCVFEEYRRFAGQRLHQQHEQFVELFDTDLVVVGPGSADFVRASSSAAAAAAIKGE